MHVESFGEIAQYGEQFAYVRFTSARRGATRGESQENKTKNNHIERKKI